MSHVVTPSMTADKPHSRTIQPAPVPKREDYDGVTCRPTTVAPGPQDASRWLKLRCKLDTFCDRSETRIRTFAWRGVGKAEKIASRFGMGGLYRHIPVVRSWRTPTPIVAPIFIVGSPRSGTTILGKVLGHQGDVLFLSEARPIWFGAVPELDERGFRWSGGVLCGRIGLDETDVTVESKASLEACFGRMLTMSGRRRLMEKMPKNVLRVRWLRAMWPDARFVQIMRDPLSAAASNATLWPNVDERRFPYWGIMKRLIMERFPERATLVETITKPYERHLLEWRTCVEEGERLKGILGDSYCLVRLEDLQQRPEHILEHICLCLELRFTNRLRRAYKAMVRPDVRLATPQLGPARCRALLGQTAERWGYHI